MGWGRGPRTRKVPGQGEHHDGKRVGLLPGCSSAGSCGPPRHGTPAWQPLHPQPCAALRYVCLYLKQQAQGQPCLPLKAPAATLVGRSTLGCEVGRETAGGQRAWERGRAAKGALTACQNAATK